MTVALLLVCSVLLGLLVRVHRRESEDEKMSAWIDSIERRVRELEVAAPESRVPHLDAGWRIVMADLLEEAERMAVQIDHEFGDCRGADAIAVAGDFAPSLYAARALLTDDEREAAKSRASKEREAAKARYYAGKS